MNELRLNEDNDIVLQGLKESYSGDWVNDATVTAVVKSVLGATVIGTMTMPYQAGTDGDYVGVIDKTNAATLAENTVYYVEVTIRSAPADGFRRFRRTAKYHGATP
jgi:hypothetical protein